MSDDRVVVVGTTPDYIDMINRRYPGRALFVTGTAERQGAYEPAPDGASEIVCDLHETEPVIAEVRAHMQRHGQHAVGVACYDCESLHLASCIAEAFGLPFVSAHTVALSRNKFETKQAWQKAGVSCPQTALVRTMWDALSFLDHSNGPVVLKPLSGSGSELTFKCYDRADVTQAYLSMREGLSKHRNDRMYPTTSDGFESVNPRQVVAAEEYIEGREYSCDFILENGAVQIIRIARKIRPTDLPFGTTLVYEVPARLPGHMDQAVLSDQLRRAAEALGMSRAFCMVDFIIRDNVPILLEMTPRPGGDCLPPLILRSSDLDVLGLELDFAARRELHIPPPENWRPVAGVRLFASQKGRVTKFDTSAVKADHQVLECYLKRRPGHVVELPPDDYDSWLLGHVIFTPENDRQVELQGRKIAEKLIVEMEQVTNEAAGQTGREGRRADRAADSAA